MNDSECVKYVIHSENYFAGGNFELIYELHIL